MLIAGPTVPTDAQWAKSLGEQFRSDIANSLPAVWS
jgi:hypothetical protein